MAVTTTDKYWGEKLKIQQQEIEFLQQQLMIGGKGGSPYEPYDPPKGPKENEPYVPAPGKIPDY